MVVASAGERENEELVHPLKAQNLFCKKKIILEMDGTEGCTRMWRYLMLLSEVMSDSATLWTAACQALPSMVSPGKSTTVGCHALLQGIFLTQGLNLCLLRLPALVGMFFTTSATWEAQKWLRWQILCYVYFTTIF